MEDAVETRVAPVERTQAVRPYDAALMGGRIS